MEKDLNGTEKEEGTGRARNETDWGANIMKEV